MGGSTGTQKKSNWGFFDIFQVFGVGEGLGGSGNPFFIPWNRFFIIKPNFEKVKKSSFYKICILLITHHLRRAKITPLPQWKSPHSTLYIHRVKPQKIDVLKNLEFYMVFCTVQYCTALYSTVQHCTVLYIAVRYCTVQYCTVLYSTQGPLGSPGVPPGTLGEGRRTYGHARPQRR